MQIALSLRQHPADAPVEGHAHLDVLHYSVVRVDTRGLQGRTRQFQEGFVASSFEMWGVASDQLADAHGEARRLRRLEDAPEEHGVHARAADVVEQRGDLQLPQRLTLDAKPTRDAEHHLRGACGVGLVVAGDDAPGPLWVRHVVQREDGGAVYGWEGLLHA